jgi:hypothetical protein
VHRRRRKKGDELEQQITDLAKATKGVEAAVKAVKSENED